MGDVIYEEIDKYADSSFHSFNVFNTISTFLMKKKEPKKC